MQSIEIPFHKPNSKILIIGEDIKNHERVDNIIKLLATIKKYSDFDFLILDEDLENKINSCEDFDLEEIEELKSQNEKMSRELEDLKKHIK